MAMEITNNYSSYASQYIAGNCTTNGIKKKYTEQTSETANSSKSKSTAEYMSELARLVPSVDMKVGNTYSTAKSGKTLTINPKLLEEMQNDPEKEKEMKELIKGVESMTKLMDGIYKASGWKVEYRHGYIDENGKYRAVSCVRNEFMYNLSDNLREERRKNSEKLIEKTKEKAAEKKKELEEALEEKRIEKGDEKTGKAEKLIKEKIADSKDGIIYMGDADFREIMETMKEDNADTKGQPAVGANLDLQV